MEAFLYFLLELNIVFAAVGISIYAIKNYLSPVLKRYLILIVPFISLMILGARNLFQQTTEMSTTLIELDPVTITDSAEKLPLNADFSKLFFFLLALPAICAIIYRILRPFINVFKSDYKQKGTLKVAVKGNTSFSFFNWITVEEGLSKEEADLVVHHESLHAKLGHTYDCIIYEIYSLFFWLNPVYHILRKEMKINHEYQVDQILFERYENKYVNLLLNHTFGTSSIAYLLTNQFMDASQLKKRILEMKTKRKQKLAWLLVVPVLGLAATTVSFTNQESKEKIEKTQGDEDNFIKASFKGGMDQYIAYFVKEVKYPEAAKSKNIEGKVFVEFTVKKDGSIKDVSVKKSSNSIFDKESLRVVNAMPKWNPATKNGKAVNSKMVVPIQFKF